MRTITQQQIKQLESSDDVLSFIMRTPKPDFTELNRLSKQFEESMKKTHEEDLKKIARAVQGK
jgi:hypothetical protein